MLLELVEKLKLSKEVAEVKVSEQMHFCLLAFHEVNALLTSKFAEFLQNIG